MKMMMIGRRRRRREGVKRGDWMERIMGRMDERGLLGRGLVGEKIAYLMNGLGRFDQILAMREMNWYIGDDLLVDKLLDSGHLIADASNMEGS